MAFVDGIEATVDLDGVVETTYRSSGAGGQHRNKTDSAVRLKHPSGLIVCAENERSQWRNRQLAWVELERRLSESAKQGALKEVNSNRKAQLEGSGWTFCEWRDSVVSATGKARFSDVMKGRNWHKLG